METVRDFEDALKARLKTLEEARIDPALTDAEAKLNDRLLTRLTQFANPKVNGADVVDNQRTNVRHMQEPAGAPVPFDLVTIERTVLRELMDWQARASRLSANDLAAHKTPATPQAKNPFRSERSLRARPLNARALNR